MVDRVELRTYCFLDQLQPHYAAFLGTVVWGDLPIQGMAALFIEVAPGSEIYSLVDVALKSSQASLGAQVIEREYGLIQMHSLSQAAIHDAGQAVLDELGLEERDRIPPKIVSTQIIKDIDPQHAQLLHRFRRGTIISVGETLLVIECVPAAYANLIANESEKQADIGVVEISGLGRFGRVWLVGEEAEILKAQAAAEATVADLQTI
jgi:hypothetical protein